MAGLVSEVTTMPRYWCSGSAEPALFLMLTRSLSCPEEIRGLSVPSFVKFL